MNPFKEAGDVLGLHQIAATLLYALLVFEFEVLVDLPVDIFYCILLNVILSETAVVQLEVAEHLGEFVRKLI